MDFKTGAYMSVAEISEKCELPKYFLHAAMREGIISYIRISRKRFIAVAALQEQIENGVILTKENAADISDKARAQHNNKLLRKQGFSYRLGLLMKQNYTCVADLAGYLGVSRSTAQHYVSGIAKPDKCRMKEIADYFNVSEEWLLYGDRETDL